MTVIANRRALRDRTCSEIESPFPEPIARPVKQRVRCQAGGDEDIRVKQILRLLTVLLDRPDILCSHHPPDTHRRQSIDDLDLPNRPARTGSAFHDQVTQNATKALPAITSHRLRKSKSFFRKIYGCSHIDDYCIMMRPASTS